jgi:hypothetical protein
MAPRFVGENNSPGGRGFISEISLLYLLKVSRYNKWNGFNPY